MRFLPLFLILLCSPAWAVTAVVYDPNDSDVPNRVVQFGDIEGTHLAPTNSIVIDSPNSSHSSAEAQVLLDNKATMDSLRSSGVHYRRWKVVGGLLQEMSQAEKDLLNQGEQDAVVASVRSNAEAGVDTFSQEYVLVRALALIVLDEINILRAQHGLPPRTIQQLKNAMKNKIQAGDAD